MMFENTNLIIKDIHFLKKQNIDHALAITNNEMVNCFIRDTFAGWENVTFDTFDLVKNKDTIAIDIGSWIGTTAIWLSKNFSNVICIEADNEAINHLKVNLLLSNCRNVLICENPISCDCSNLIFGPRNNGSWNVLNNSTSHLKVESDSIHDYTKKCITFKQIIYNYVHDLNKKVSFIKCDIEGGEDCILEDIFCYCLINDATCYISFHLNWWRSANYLDIISIYFKYFDCYELIKKIEDPLSHIKSDPFCSLLFRPKMLTEKIRKINRTILISSYKDISELELILVEIRKFTNDIIIVNDDDTIDMLPYFILKDNQTNTKRDNFIKYLLMNGCIVLSANRISQLLENPQELNIVMTTYN